jgi:hypothetical protein
MLTKLFRIDHTMSPARSALEIERRLETLAPDLDGEQKTMERMLSLTPSRPDQRSELVAIKALTKLFTRLASSGSCVMFIDD